MYRVFFDNSIHLGVRRGLPIVVPNKSDFLHLMKPLSRAFMVLQSPAKRPGYADIKKQVIGAEEPIYYVRGVEALIMFHITIVVRRA